MCVCVCVCVCVYVYERATTSDAHLDAQLWVGQQGRWVSGGGGGLVRCKSKNREGEKYKERGKKKERENNLIKRAKFLH